MLQGMFRTCNKGHLLSEKKDTAIRDWKYFEFTVLYMSLLLWCRPHCSFYLFWAKCEYSVCRAPADLVAVQLRAIAFPSVPSHLTTGYIWRDYQLKLKEVFEMYHPWKLILWASFFSFAPKGSADFRVALDRSQYQNQLLLHLPGKHKLFFEKTHKKDTGRTFPPGIGEGLAKKWTEHFQHLIPQNIFSSQCSLPCVYAYIYKVHVSNSPN